MSSHEINIPAKDRPLQGSRGARVKDAAEIVELSSPALPADGQDAGDRVMGDFGELEPVGVVTESQEPVDGLAEEGPGVVGKEVEGVVGDAEHDAATGGRLTGEQFIPCFHDGEEAVCGAGVVTGKGDGAGGLQAGGPPELGGAGGQLDALSGLEPRGDGMLHIDGDGMGRGFLGASVRDGDSGETVL